MNEPDRIIELLTEIRDELRESREKTLERYDDVIANSQKNDASNLIEWRENQRAFDVWFEYYEAQSGRWFRYSAALMTLTILLAGSVLLLAWTR